MAHQIIGILCTPAATSDLYEASKRISSDILFTIRIYRRYILPRRAVPQEAPPIRMICLPVVKSGFIPRRV